MLCDCRVDGKDVISAPPQRRLSFDCKTSKPVFAQQSDVVVHMTSRDDMDKVGLSHVLSKTAGVLCGSPCPDVKI